MKIAIVLSGKGRLLEESSFWWKNRILNQCPPEIEIDFYCHFWNDNEIDLDKRIVDTFNPVKYSTDSYHEWYESFSQRVLEYNKDYKFSYDELPDKYLFDVPNWLFFHGHSHNTRHKIFPRHPAYNFYGQYISSGRAVRVIGKEKINEYDMILKTRSDVCINPDGFSFCLNKILEEIIWRNNSKLRDKYWIRCYERVKEIINPNVVKNISIYTSGASCISNNLVPPDLIFFSDSKSSWFYYTNIEDRIYNLLTKDKNILLGLYNKNNYIICAAHTFWSILTIDEEIFGGEFLSLSGINDIGTTLIRKHYDELELKDFKFDKIKEYNESPEFEDIRRNADWNK